MNRKIYTILFLLGCLVSAKSQTFNQYQPEQIDTSENYGYFNFVQLRLHRGSNLTQSKTDWVQDIYSASGYTGLDLRIGFQTTGLFDWEQLLNYPQFGFGFSTFFYGNREVENLVGQPSGVYAFLDLPFHRSRNGKFYATFDLAAGFAYDLNAYDPITNPYNDAVGSKILFYFDFDFAGNHKISQRMDLNYGLHLTHFSNGRTRTPNLGVNMLGLDLGLRYYFNPMRPYVKASGMDFEPPIRPTF